jgi:hypothetical protein
MKHIAVQYNELINALTELSAVKKHTEKTIEPPKFEFDEAKVNEFLNKLSI